MKRVGMNKNIQFREATMDDLPGLEEIRSQAFQPIFNSFREILGEEIYKRAQEPEDRQQAEMLRELLEPDSQWSVFVLLEVGELVGFISIKMDEEAKVGEIGLNAVHPDYAGNGQGTLMYEFAIEQMKQQGMKVATVATGGDPSHSPARRAYEKAGFDVQIPSVWMCQEL